MELAYKPAHLSAARYILAALTYPINRGRAPESGGDRDEWACVGRSGVPALGGSSDMTAAHGGQRGRPA